MVPWDWVRCRGGVFRWGGTQRLSEDGGGPLATAVPRTRSGTTSSTSHANILSEQNGEVVLGDLPHRRCHSTHLGDILDFCRDRLPHGSGQQGGRHGSLRRVRGRGDGLWSILHSESAEAPRRIATQRRNPTDTTSECQVKVPRRLRGTYPVATGVSIVLFRLETLSAEVRWPGILEALGRPDGPHRVIPRVRVPR